MQFEDKYMTIVKMCTKHLEGEETLAKVSKSGIKTIYIESHPLHAVLTFLFANLFLRDARVKYQTLMNVDTRAQVIRRVRLLALHITSLVGDDCIKQIVKNQIDGLLRLSGSPSRALRRALEKVYADVSITWLLVILGEIYTTALDVMVANRAAASTKTPVQNRI